MTTDRAKALNELVAIGAIADAAKFSKMPERDFEILYTGVRIGMRQAQKMLHEVEEYRDGVHLYLRDHEHFIKCPFCGVVLDLVEA